MKVRASSWKAPSDELPGAGPAKQPPSSYYVNRTEAEEGASK